MFSKNILFDSFIDNSSIEYLAGKDFKLPFENVLNFKVLIEYIKRESQSENKSKREISKILLDEINSKPEIMSDIRDMKVVERNEELIKNMMLFVFPDYFSESHAFAAVTPFTDKVIFCTRKFKEMFMNNGQLNNLNLNITPETYIFGTAIGAYGYILSRYYGFEYRFNFSIVNKIINPINGLDLYYKMNLANEFVNTEIKGKLNNLSESDKAEIKKRIYDLEFLHKKIDPSKFKFTGFIVINMINISDTEILSAIRKELIEKDSITTYIGFLKLQHHLKSLLNCPGLLLGLLDIVHENGELTDIGKRIGNSFCIQKKRNYNLLKIKGSIYEKVIRERKIVLIEDINNYEEKTIVEEDFLNQGISNILVAPLIINDEVIGLFEIVSPEPDKINQLNSVMLYEVLPLFSIAVSRIKMERLNKIQAVIKQQCTAIHPSLEWKFKEAALKLLNTDRDGHEGQMEEIKFNGVYPLFGLSDIRSSSLHRDNSIREDLIDNLKLALDVIEKADNVKPMEAFSELKYRIIKKINSLKYSINSGDEIEVVKFLNEKIVTMFGSMSEYGEKVISAIDAYNSGIDKELGFVYRNRKKFEESASALNDMIASYLDREQIKIQKIFPHYFERFKTDGVDHNIYIGQEMVKSIKFNPIYLRNLRLWQLLVMCRVALKSKIMENKLPYKLETAHLILVQDTPITIRFRYDEKKFDVDGAYNIRYEILKKRIDKAEIKGREERLTQPGKIAIVYNQTSEASEYHEYIEYLQTLDILKREVDEFELEDLQGIKGLRALRVTVNMADTMESEKNNSEFLIKEFSTIKTR